MPIEVDIEARLRAIAEATMAVAERDGVHAVSYRSVARRLGGSTALVTNYLPTRSALLHNALRHMTTAWHEDMSAAAKTASPGDRLRSLALWSCTTDPQDLVLRSVLIHALTEQIVAPAEVLEAFRRDADEHRQALLDAARDDEFANLEPLVDALYLVCRGFYLSTLEDLESWGNDRAGAAIDEIVSAWPRLRPSAAPRTSAAT